MSLPVQDVSSVDGTCLSDPALASNSVAKCQIVFPVTPLVHGWRNILVHVSGSDERKFTELSCPISWIPWGWSHSNLCRFILFLSWNVHAVLVERLTFAQRQIMKDGRVASTAGASVVVEPAARAEPPPDSLGPRYRSVWKWNLGRRGIWPFFTERGVGVFLSLRHTQGRLED